jgi:hypothetical protein
MAIESYTAKIQIDLTGICYQQCIPAPIVSVNEHVVRPADPLDGNHLIEFSLNLPAGKHNLTIVFDNKQYINYPSGHDMAVVINSLRFQNLDEDFRIYGKYYPEYPEPWATEQRQNNIDLPKCCYADYLGWNGKWQMQFCTPIYPWIHKTLNLGWLI